MGLAALPDCIFFVTSTPGTGFGAEVDAAGERQETGNADQRCFLMGAMQPITRRSQHTFNQLSLSIFDNFGLDKVRGG